MSEFGRVRFVHSVRRLPILPKGPCSVNRGLVDTSGGGDIVGTPVSVEATLALRSAAGVVGAVGLNNVVFYKWVARPSVNSEVAVALGLERSTVVDHTK